MNKEQSKDYYEGVFLVCFLFVIGIFLDKANEFMLLILSLTAMRFVALSRDDAKGENHDGS